MPKAPWACGPQSLKEVCYARPSDVWRRDAGGGSGRRELQGRRRADLDTACPGALYRVSERSERADSDHDGGSRPRDSHGQDRKSTRLNSSHLVISYAVFCLKKKKKKWNNMYGVIITDTNVSKYQPGV